MVDNPCDRQDHSNRPDGNSAASASDPSPPGGQPVHMMPPDVLAARASALAAAVRELAAARDLGQVLETATGAVLLVIPHAQEAAMYLLDEAGTSLVPRSACSRAVATQEWPPLELDDALRRQLPGRDVCLVPAADPTAAPFASALCHLSPVLLAPVHGGGAPLGLLCARLAPDSTCYEQDMEQLGALAAQASLALRLAATSSAPLERLFRETIEYLAQGIIILDDEGRIRYLNAALRRLLMLDWTNSELACFPSAPECPPDLRALLDPSAGEILGPYSVSLDLPTRSQITLSVLPSKLYGGGEARLVMDASYERQEAETRSQFVSQVAHELRTPLQHIMGFASILADVGDLTEETRQRFLNHITEESAHLARLVEDLAEVSRIENGRFTLDKKNVRIDELLADIIARFSPGAAAKGLELTIHQTGQPVWVLTDRFRLEQVVTNLIENAIKFVQSGGTIDVSVDASDSEVTIRVSDTGPGIPSEALQRIFERYYQVPQRDGQVGPGMGLGLYISREIVHSLGGEIWVESELGQGSTFYVRLPRR